MKTSCRILLLNTQMEAAGAQRASIELARGLKQLGHEVTMATLYDKADYVREFSESYGLNIIDLQMKATGGPIKKVRHFVQGLLRLRGVLLNREIEILQTFDFYSNALGPLAARSARVPICVTSQRNSSRGGKKWLRSFARAITNSEWVQMMTAVSEHTRLESITEEGIRPEKIMTIYNGIAVERFEVELSPTEELELRQSLGVDETAVIVTTVARLHPQKGHTYLLQAIKPVTETMPNVRFLFIGEGALQAEIEHKIKEAGLSPFVLLPGVRTDIPQILSISDLFVLPSLWEGLPNALLEAMAAGLPVVSTNVDGCSELVVEGVTGLLVPPASPQPLADAILHVLRNSDLASQFGRAGKARAQQTFSRERNLSSYVDLYASLLRGMKQQT